MVLAYPDLNVLSGNSIQLPCDLSGAGQMDQPLPVMEHDVDGLPKTIDNNNNNNEDHVNRMDQMYKSDSSAVPTVDPFSSDAVQLILWYHGSDISGSPFYSVDARHSNVIDQRNKAAIMWQKHEQYGQQQHQQQSSPSPSPIHSPQHQSNGSNFEAKLKHFVVPPYNGRARFELRGNKHTSSSQQAALLTLDSVREEDGGWYWCRVDYRWTRTTISKIRLNVLGKLALK